MTRILSITTGALFLLAAIFCWYRAAQASAYTTGMTGYLLHLESSPPLTRQQLELLEEESNPYLLARESTGSAEAPLLSRRKEVTLLETVGAPALLFPAGALLQGSFAEEDGCVIDVGTARSFWGQESAALGQVVELNGREFTVTGLLDSSRPVLVAARDRSEEFIPTLAVYQPTADAAFPRQDLSRFLTSVSLVDAYTNDLGRNAERLQGLALFPTWLFCCLAAARFLKGLLPHRRSLRFGLLLVGCYLIGRLLGFPMLFYSDMLPTRWSNFSFWSEHLRSVMDHLSTRILLPTSLPDYLLLHSALLPTALWSLAALFCYLFAYRRMQTEFSIAQSD